MIVRGGGGGHGGGGGGGGGGHGGGSVHYYSNGYANGTRDPLSTWVYVTVAIVYMGFLLIIPVYSRYKVRKRREKDTARLIKEKKLSIDEVEKHVTDIFLKFQKDWGGYNTESMSSYVTSEYLKKVSLQLQILQQAGRRNIMSGVTVLQIHIVDSEYENKNPAKITVRINASAIDVLQKNTGETIHTDDGDFTEYWNFKKSENGWMLDGIEQSVSLFPKNRQKYAQFAQKNGLFFDYEYGTMSLPEKGRVFARKYFNQVDVYDHASGQYSDIPFEIYSLHLNQGGTRIVSHVYNQTKYKHVIFGKSATPKLFSKEKELIARVDKNKFNIKTKYSISCSVEDMGTIQNLINTGIIQKIESLGPNLTVEIFNDLIICYAPKSPKITYEQVFDVTKLLIDTFSNSKSSLKSNSSLGTKNKV